MESRYALQTLAHTQATEAEQKKEILREGFFSRISMQDLTLVPLLFALLFAVADLF
jgi:hypothetical protein